MPASPRTNPASLLTALGEANDDAIRAAAEIPLSRAHGPVGLRGIATERRDLWTGEAKARKGCPTSWAAPTCTESWMHTDDCVFLYLAGFGYPDTEAGFLFRQSLEADPALPAFATPFDSGSLWAHHDWPGCPAVDTTASEAGIRRADAARDFLQQHTFASPAHREYLACILSRCFTHPSDYLRGISPTVSDPHGLIASPNCTSDHRRWTFELRIPVKHAGGLPVPSPHLEAVFVRSELQRDRDLRPFLMECRNQGAKIILTLRE